MAGHIKGNCCPSGLEVKGNLNSIIQGFLIFFNCIILVQILTMLKVLCAYDALKNNFDPQLDTKECRKLSMQYKSSIFFSFF